MSLSNVLADLWFLSGLNTRLLAFLLLCSRQFEYVLDLDKVFFKSSDI